MPAEALQLELDVVLKPMSSSDVPLREGQPDASRDLDVNQRVPSQETLAVATQEPGTTTRSQEMLRQANIMYASMLYTMLLSGWNDGTTGPLLPRIQLVYHVWYSCFIGRRGEADIVHGF